MKKCLCEKRGMVALSEQGHTLIDPRDRIGERAAPTTGLDTHRGTTALNGKDSRVAVRWLGRARDLMEMH